MEINRNQFFLFGMVALFLGLQFLLTHEYVMTPEFTKFLAERTGHPSAAAIETADRMNLSTQTFSRSKNFQPPPWLGWAFTSAGSVLILHAMAMRKPD